MLNNVVLPKLNRTTKNETLYSIKSKKNSSPHARMMQSLKKKKNKSKPIPETVDSFKEKSKVKQSRFTKPKKEISIKEWNSNQYYEITTIEEDKEGSLQNFRKSQKSKITQGYAENLHKNSQYGRMNPDLITDIITEESPLFQKEKLGSKRNSSLVRSMEKSQYFESSKPLQASASQVPEFKVNENTSTRIFHEKSKLPKIGDKIPGRITQNGIFKPYTFSVNYFNYKNIGIWR